MSTQEKCACGALEPAASFGLGDNDLSYGLQLGESVLCYYNPDLKVVWKNEDTGQIDVGAAHDRGREP